MTTKLTALALLILLAVGCAPDKERACAGCEGTELRDCEIAYEECDGIAHCRRTDIRRDWAENKCLGDDSEF